jgi:glycosyltransferase involved in cell wall biosynthesis
MNRLRIILLAHAANPDSFSSPLVGYSHSEALARLHSVTLLVGSSSEKAIGQRSHPFHRVEVIRLPWLDRINSWCFQWVFKGRYTSQALTAFSIPFYLAFEWRAWRLLRGRIKAGEFDAVVRLMPITAVVPSLFPFLLRRGPIPFVIGPLNGGLPWPKGFRQSQRTKEWISNFRTLYRIVPFTRSTYRHAKAIIAGSSQTYSEFLPYVDKLFFIPENGIACSLLDSVRPSTKQRDKLEYVFIGGLVPIKGCDLALRAAAPFLKARVAHFTIVGDGPERMSLEDLARVLQIKDAVTFRGMLPHEEAMKCMMAGDVFIFPSIRDFGAGVVFEALATGVVPIVIDFGGPGDIVYPEVGYKVPLTNENDIVKQIGKILTELHGDRDLLDRLREQGMRYAKDSLSWDGKAQALTKVLKWVIGKGPKPSLSPPKEIPRKG